MSVLSFDEGDLFRYTIIKHHSLNPLDQWANTYEARAGDAGGPSALNQLSLRLIAFEQSFAFDSTIFDRMIISTWEPDSAPYDPSNFVSTSIGQSGATTPANQALGLSTVLHVTRNAGYGREGHLFYRNCLTEADISAPAGKNVLVSVAGTNATIQTAFTDAELGDNIGATPAGLMHLVMVNADGTQIRNIMSLVVVGVTQVKTDHKWYNRTSGP